MAIPIRKVKEIEEIKKPAQLVAKTLKLLRENTKPGITPLELDKLAEDFIRSIMQDQLLKVYMIFQIVYV